MLRAQGRLGLLAQVLAVRACASIDVGRFREALSEAEEGNRLAVETGQPIWAALSQTDLGMLQGLRGEEALAEKLISEAGGPFIPEQLGILLAEGELARGITAMTAGRYSDAFDHFVRIVEPGGAAHHEFVTQATASGHVAGKATTGRSLRTDARWAPYVIECAVRAGHLDEARAILMKLEALGQRTPAALVHVGFQYGQALLADESEAESLYKRALDAAPRWPFYIARLQMSFGTWLRRQRRITESRPFLRAARETFLSLGLNPWADKAAVELRASGERIAEPTVTPRQALSPQELQIAEMAASGLSNREIAARLFLSHRTVGAHLYRIFPKLGIVSRSEIAEALAAIEPLPST